MGKLVIVLAFSLGALLMLESVQATECDIHIIRMTMPGNIVKDKPCSESYKIVSTIDLKRLQTDIPNNYYLLQTFTKFHVSDCKMAEDALKKDKDLKHLLGTWFQIKSPLAMTAVVTDIQEAIKKFILPKAMAEGDDDDYNMIDGGNSQNPNPILKLLSRPLD